MAPTLLSVWGAQTRVSVPQRGASSVAPTLLSVRGPQTTVSVPQAPLRARDCRQPPRIAHQRDHLAHCRFHPHERGARDDRMADVQLLDVFADSDRVDVAVIEAVTGENDQSHLPRGFRRGVDFFQLVRPGSARPAFGELAGIDLDLRRADFLALPDLLEVRIDEDRNVDLRFDQLPHDLVEIP